MKRKIMGLFLMFFVFCNSAFAMEPVGVTMVKDAQNFGVMNVSKSANELEKPWIFFNVLKKHKKDKSEKIIVYTPYLVTALDAQNKTKSGGFVNEQFGLVLAENYKNVLVVGAMLESKKKLEANDLQIDIEEDNKIILPYYVVVDSTKKEFTAVDKRMSLSDALKYKKQVDEIESNKKYASREVEILSLSYKPFEEKTLKQENKKNTVIDVKTKSIVLKRNEKENSFSKYLEKKKLKRAFKAEKEQNKSNEPVIVREKKFNWQIDFLIYFDMNEINIGNNIVLKIKEPYASKRAFKFDLSNVK